MRLARLILVNDTPTLLMLGVDEDKHQCFGHLEVHRAG